MRSVLRAASVIVGLACASGLAAEAPSAAAYATPDRADFSGVYRLSGGAHEKAEIRAVIDAATQDMSILRDTARKRLYETTEPLALLVIGFPPDRISVGFFGERPVVTTDGGEPIKWRNHLGDKAEVSQRFAGGTIVQRYAGAMGGKRKSVYRLSADQKTITVDTVVTAPIMPKPVEFKTTYLRK